MLEDIFTINMLYDFYGNLLPQRQREFVRLYREENWSLSEIAEEFVLTRQGVYDSVRKAEKALYEYESKLKLMERFRKTEQALRHIDRALTQLIEQSGEDTALAVQLRRIKNTADALGE